MSSWCNFILREWSLLSLQIKTGGPWPQVIAFLSEPAYLRKYLAEQLQILARGWEALVDMLPLHDRARGGFPRVRPSPRWGSSPDIFSEAWRYLMLGKGRACWLRSSQALASMNHPYSAFWYQAGTRTAGAPQKPRDVCFTPADAPSTPSWDEREPSPWESAEGGLLGPFLLCMVSASSVCLTTHSVSDVFMDRSIFCLFLPPEIQVMPQPGNPCCLPNTDTYILLIMR